MCSYKHTFLVIGEKQVELDPHCSLPSGSKSKNEFTGCCHFVICLMVGTGMPLYVSEKLSHFPETGLCKT
jgi:hypothetical protein